MSHANVGEEKGWLGIPWLSFHLLMIHTLEEKYVLGRQNPRSTMIYYKFYSLLFFCASTYMGGSSSQDPRTPNQAPLRTSTTQQQACRTSLAPPRTSYIRADNYFPQSWRGQAVCVVKACFEEASNIFCLNQTLKNFNSSNAWIKTEWEIYRNIWVPFIIRAMLPPYNICESKDTMEQVIDMN